MIEPVVERWAADCSVYHGDACPETHPTPLQLWLIAKAAHPGRLAGPRLAHLRMLMKDHGMLP